MSLMNEEDIKAEIERRKEKAKSLKLRETVWNLYSSQFKYIDERLQKDFELILPEVRETLKRSDSASEFGFNGTNYRLVCIERKREREHYGSDKTVTTHLTLSLNASGRLVFEFNMRTSVTYAPDQPIFDDYMGEITAFIEGPWIADIVELLQEMMAHVQEVWKRRNAPKEAQRLKKAMKKFGL